MVELSFFSSWEERPAYLGIFGNVCWGVTTKDKEVQRLLLRSKWFSNDYKWGDWMWNHFNEKEPPKDFPECVIDYLKGENLEVVNHYGHKYTLIAKELANEREKDFRQSVKTQLEVKKQNIQLIKALEEKDKIISEKDKEIQELQMKLAQLTT